MHAHAGVASFQQRADGHQHCTYCGSLSPESAAAALRAGAAAHWADWKYGWPHKAYLDNVPDARAGQPWICGWSSRSMDGWELFSEAKHGALARAAGITSCREGETWVQVRARDATTTGKFYTAHLQDASPADRDTIERALGLRFTFEGTRVSWHRIGD